MLVLLLCACSSGVASVYHGTFASSSPYLSGGGADYLTYTEAITQGIEYNKSTFIPEEMTLTSSSGWTDFGAAYVVSAATGLQEGDIVRSQSVYEYRNGADESWQQYYSVDIYLLAESYVHTSQDTIVDTLHYIQEGPDGFDVIVGSGLYDANSANSGTNYAGGEQFRLVRTITVYRNATLNDPQTSSRGYTYSLTGITGGTVVLDDTYDSIMTVHPTVMSNNKAMVSPGNTAWGSGVGVVLPESYNLANGDLTVVLYNVDMRQSRQWNWTCPFTPPLPSTDFKAGIAFGTTNATTAGPDAAPPNAAYVSLDWAGSAGQALYYTAQQWAAGTSPATPVSGPAFDFSTPYSGTSSSGGYLCTGDPDYDTFDLKLVYEDAGTSTRVRAYQRVHRSDAPLSEPANSWLAMNIGSSTYQDIADTDLAPETLHPFIVIANRELALSGATISWGDVLAYQAADANATLILHPTGESLYVQPGETVTVSVDVADLPSPVNGCQATFGFDSTYLQAAAGCVAPGGYPWDNLLYTTWDAGTGVPGEIDTAIGIDASMTNTTVGTTADATIAVIQLTAASAEGSTQLVFRPDVSDVESTWFSDLAYNPVYPTRINSPSITVDGTVPNLNLVSVVQDSTELLIGLGSTTTAIQGQITITVEADDVLSGLSGAPEVSIEPFGAQEEYARLIDNNAGVFTYTYTIDASTPNGVAAVHVQVRDRADNVAQASGSFEINSNQITGLVELEQLYSGVIRDVIFVATDSANNVLDTWTLPLTHVGTNGNPSHTGQYVLTRVPSATAYLSAKANWNLRERLPVTLINGQAVTDFIGDVSDGWDDANDHYLRGGDLSGNNSINYVDFGILADYWYQFDSTADINGSGAVNYLDFGIMAENWYQSGDPQ